MPKIKEKIDYVCLSTLKSRGWTDTLINKLLPAPKLVKNPHYRTSAEMKLWDIRDVEKAEESEEFKIRLEKLIEREQKKKAKKEDKLNKMAGEINLRNPAKDYPIARSIHRHFILNIGETNTGKTYTALQALKQAKTGTYLAPLRLLAMEIQDRLLDDGIPCSMITGEEENIIDGAKIVSSTVEKISLDTIYEVGVIDECQMIADRDRGGSWTKAILGLAAETIYLCMSPDAENICVKLIEMCGDTYEINMCERKVPLEYTGMVSMQNLQRNDAVVLFSRRNVLQFAEDVKKYGLRPSVVYGALPYKARKNQVEMYNSGKTDIIIATDAIGMGMNLPIKRVIFAEIEKFDGIEGRRLLPTEIKQIAGRAGRQGMFNKGFVGTLASLGNTKHISNGLQEKNKKIDSACVPFPEELIKHSEDKLSKILTEWAEIKYPKIFKQQNLSNTIDRVKYIEKKYKELDKRTILKLATVMFDEKDEVLMEDWEKYVYDFVCDREISFPHINAIDLRGYERRYKELDLYYSFNRSMNLPMDVNKVMEAKEEVIEKINQLLVETNSKKQKKKHCRHCGKKLPNGFKFTLCDKCYHNMMSARYFDEDNFF